MRTTILSTVFILILNYTFCQEGDTIKSVIEFDSLEIAKIELMVSLIPTDSIWTFESKYETWLESTKKPEIQLLSDPEMYKTQEYYDFKEYTLGLGPNYIGLLIDFFEEHSTGVSYFLLLHITIEDYGYLVSDAKKDLDGLDLYAVAWKRSFPYAYFKRILATIQISDLIEDNPFVPSDSCIFALDSLEIAKIDSIISLIPCDSILTFEAKYEAWIESTLKPEIQIHSNPEKYKTEEYYDFKEYTLALGDVYIGLLIDFFLEHDTGISYFLLLDIINDDYEQQLNETHDELLSLKLDYATWHDAFPICSFKKILASIQVSDLIEDNPSDPSDSCIYELDSLEIAKIDSIVSLIPPEYISTFEAKYEAWMVSIDKPEFLLQSNPNSFKTEEFYDFEAYTLGLGDVYIGLLIDFYLDHDTELNYYLLLGITFDDYVHFVDEVKNELPSFYLNPQLWFKALPICYFKKILASIQVSDLTVNNPHAPSDSYIFELDSMEIAKIDSIVSLIPPEYISTFEAKYEAWMVSIDKPEFHIQSNPNKFKTEEFYDFKEYTLGLGDVYIGLLIDFYLGNDTGISETLLLGITYDDYGYLVDEVKSELRIFYLDHNFWLQAYPICYFKKILASIQVSDLTVNNPHEPSDTYVFELDSMEIAKIDSIVSLIPSDSILTFEAKYQTWIESTQKPEIQMHSNPEMYKTDEYYELEEYTLALGDVYIGLLIDFFLEQDTIGFLKYLLLDIAYDDYEQLLHEARSDLKELELESDAWFDALPICYFKKILATIEVSELERKSVSQSVVITQKQAVKIYPNPIHDYLTIEFELEKAKTVSIKLYNYLGQLQDVIRDKETFYAGQNSATWNRKDNIVPGNYLLTFESDGFVDSIQIVVK